MLRRLLSLLLLVLASWVQSATFYVSPTGSDTNNGTSTTTPWKTIDKVNAMGSTLTAGSFVLFQRGASFRGKLNVPSNGTSAAKITFGAYGTGAAPVISGSVQPTGWTVHSGNIWKVAVSQAVKNVYFNGSMQTIARYPNTGWLRTDNASSTSMTDAALNQGSGYWTGARMVLRTTNWSYDTAFVTAHNGSTLTHSATGNALGAQQWGYFLENKLSQLDAAGEWFYDRATGFLYVWCPGNANPNTSLVEAAVMDFGIYFAYQRHDAIITDLTFQHQIDCSIRLSGTYNVEVANCLFQDTQRAIYSTGNTQQVHHNTITRNYQTAVYMLDNNSSFTFNNVNNTALWPGKGENNWGYFGLRCNGTGMVVSDNRFENIGYIGMVIEKNTLVERNVVRSPLAILNDGGGIAFDNADGMIIRKNIVMDLVGNIESVAPEYTSFFPMGHGLYFGNIGIKNTLVEYNTVANCSSSGIHVDHTMVSSGNQIKNNTLFNNLVQLSISDYSNYNTPGAVAPFYVPSFNTIYSGNIMYCLSKEQQCMYQAHVNGATLVDYGTFTGNYYFNPYNELSIQIHNHTVGVRDYFSMERWQATFGEDVGAVRSPLRQDVYSTVSELSGNLVINGTFTSNVTGWGGYPYNSIITRDLTFLDNGAMKVNLPNASQYPTLSLRNPDQFGVQNAQWYRMRFSLQSNVHGNLSAGVKGVSQLVNANTIFSRDVPFDTQRRDLEWYFQSTMSDQALVQFTHSYLQPQYWLDNVELHRVTVQPVVPAQQHLLYVNDQATAQSFSLPSGCWKDVTAVLQGASVTLQPFTSKVVYRVTGTGCGSTAVDCAGVVGGSALPGTSCNDNNPCTVNDLWNSSCMCIGTFTPPAASITASGSTTFCPGGSVVLNASTAAGNSYAWQLNGATIAGAISSGYTATQAGNYTVMVTNNGCSTTSLAVTISVSMAPVATITAGGSTSFCTGGSVVLNANTGSGFSYSWRINGTAISGATASSYTASQTGSYSVVVTSGGCSTTSSSISVSASGGTSATLSATGAVSFCAGGSVVLSTTSGSGNTYVWKRNGVVIVGAGSSSYIATLSGSHTVEVTNGTCTAISSAITVTVSSAPPAAITAGGSTTFCAGGNVVLNASTGTGYSYVWRLNGTVLSGATSSSYTAAAAGSYTVVVSNGGCSTTSSAITVTVSSSTSASLTAGGPASFCTGGNVVLSTTTGNGNTYVWKRNGAVIVGAGSSSYIATLSGSHTVEVTNGTCIAISPAITVTVNSAPSATITAGGATTFCAGGNVVLSASTGTGYSYVWRSNGTAISGATSSTYTASASGSYTVVVSNGGCTTTSSATNVTVNTAPTAAITAGGSTSFCSGGSVVLSASTATGNTYAWRLNGTAISGATNPTYTATASGSYTVAVTNGGCTSTSLAAVISVGTVPVATITAGGSTSFCSGGNVVLSASTGTGYSYVWRLNGVAISGATSITYTASASGSYTVVISNGGCTTTSSATNVTVNTAPTAAITAGGSTSFCSGGSVVLSASTATGNTYAWRLNGTAISGATNPTFTATAAGSYTVAVTNGGCTSTSLAAVVSVGTVPVATITAGGSTSFCSGGNVVLSASTGTGYSYVWRLNGVAISSATSSSYTVTAGGSYTVVVTNSGCSTTSSATAVTVTAAPSASLSAAGPTSFCAGGSVVLSTTSGTGYSYVWKRNGTTIAGAASNSYIATLSGSHTVVVTSGACSTTSASITVTASNAPTATISAGGPAAFCSGGNVLLSASAGTGNTYVWRLNGSAISGSTASTYLATAAGTYSVIVSNGGCSTTSSGTTVAVNASPVANCSSSAAASTISVIASGGVGPYSYSWNTSPVQASATASVVSSGTYIATVTGANGCAASCSSTITVTSLNCNGTRTEAQGTWGAPATVNNPAGYMSTRFASAFPAPGYLTIGCGSRLLRFTTAASVINSLPTYGTPVLLATGTTVDPGTSLTNTLVGQIVALRLNVRFDEMDAAFSPSDVMLKDMIVATGTFTGWTVSQLLTAAEQTVGGCATTYSLSTLSNVIGLINNGYQPGVISNSSLMCPGSTRELMDHPRWAPEKEGPVLSAMTFPNPFHGSVALFLAALDPAQRATVRVLALDGSLVEVLHDAAVPADGTLRLDWEPNALAPGMYFYQVQNGSRSIQGKLVKE